MLTTRYEQTLVLSYIVMRIFCILSLMVVIAFHPEVSLGQSDSCPAGQTLEEGDISPAAIRSYVDANKDKLKDIGDVICCLPKSYRANYLIAHTSKAKQNSVFYSPRVLLFNQLQDRAGEGGDRTADGGHKPLKCVLSINGGDTELEQANSIEMMCNNTKSRQVEFFDYENKNGRFHMSEKNPEVCMSCHNDGRPVGPEGPRTIFDPPFAWPRFIKGISPCNEAENKLTTALEKAAEKDFKKNSRFRCLDPKPDGFDPFQGGTFNGSNSPGSNAIRPSFLMLAFDEHVADLSDRRNAKFAIASPDYERFKYAIIGALACSPQSPFDPIKASEWLPKKTIAEINSDNFLLPIVKNSTDLAATFKTKMKEYAAQDLKLASAQKKMADEIAAGGHPKIEFSTRPTVCNVPKAGEGRTKLLNRGKTRVRGFNGQPIVEPPPLSGTPLLDRFAVDTALRGFRRSSSNAFLRYLFEGRGISIAEWSMDLFENYSRSPGFLVKHLLEAEPTSSQLGKLKDEMKSAGMINDSEHAPANAALELREPVCQKLKELSIQALSTGPVDVKQPAGPKAVPAKQ